MEDSVGGSCPQNHSPSGAISSLAILSNSSLASSSSPAYSNRSYPSRHPTCITNPSQPMKNHRYNTSPPKSGCHQNSSRPGFSSVAFVLHIPDVGIATPGLLDRLRLGMCRNPKKTP